MGRKEGFAISERGSYQKKLNIEAAGNVYGLEGLTNTP